MFGFGRPLVKSIMGLCGVAPKWFGVGRWSVVGGQVIPQKFTTGCCCLLSGETESGSGSCWAWSGPGGQHGVRRLPGARHRHVPIALAPVCLGGLELNADVCVVECDFQACFSVTLQNKFSFLCSCPSGSQLGALGTGYHCAKSPLLPPSLPCSAAWVWAVR